MGLNRGCCEEALLLRCSIVMEAKDADVLTNGSKRSRRKSESNCRSCLSRNERRIERCSSEKSGLLNSSGIIVMDVLRAKERK